MRGSAITALAVTVAALATPVASSGADGKATLRFVRLAPVTVRGAHFLPREAVRVTLRAGSTERVRTTRTLPSGRFTVDFGLLREKDRCGTVITLVAVGGRGDRAVYRLPPRECTTAATGVGRD